MLLGLTAHLIPPVDNVAGGAAFGADRLSNRSQEAPERGVLLRAPLQ
jgi:hypothetical protein